MAARQPVPLSAHWELDGPFFEKNVRKTVRENIADMLDRAAEAMQEDVRDNIAGHAGAMPNYSGWSWAQTIGRRGSRRTGKSWALHAVVSANTDGMGRSDAIRTKAAAATIERRWHPYRQAASAARRAIKTLDLTRGLE